MLRGQGRLANTAATHHSNLPYFNSFQWFGQKKRVGVADRDRKSEQERVSLTVSEQATAAGRWGNVFDKKHIIN